MKEKFSEEKKQESLLTFVGLKSFDELISKLPEEKRENEIVLRTIELTGFIKEFGFDTSAVFDPSTVRGLDYYTGLVFEVYDMGGGLGRALFGGGRYNNLTGLFSKEAISGIGFGMGLTIIQLFLKEYDLIDIKEESKNAKILIIMMDDQLKSFTLRAANYLRAQDKNIEISGQFGQVKKQVQKAEAKGFRYISIIGDIEEKDNSLIIKDLKSDVTQKIIIK